MNWGCTSLLRSFEAIKLQRLLSKVAISTDSGLTFQFNKLQGRAKTLQTKTIAIENSTYMLTKVMVKVGLNYNFDRYDLIAVVIQHLGPLH